MKKKIISFAVLLFIFSAGFSQGFTIGIKGGANLGKISGKAFKDKYTSGFQVGGFVTVPLAAGFAIQPEVLFNQTNVDTASGFSGVYSFNKIGNIRVNTLSIPIMLNYNLNKYFTLQAGPQFGVVISQDKDLLQNGKDAFKSGNFSLAGGVQLNFLKFRVYGRFVGGLTNLDNVGSKESWKVNGIQLGVGLAL
ncbi:MAG: porin family protein [Ginsengibacter sp.]